MEQQKKTQTPPMEAKTTLRLDAELIEPDDTPLAQEDIDDNPFFKLGNILDTQGMDAAIEWVRSQMSDAGSE